MTSHFVAGAYSVRIANLETDDAPELPSPSALVPKVDSPTDDRVYRLEDMGATFTFELSPEDAARLWWIIIRSSDWLWRRYRQTLN